MISFVEYIRTSTASWNGGNKIGTSITATTGTTMRIKYVGRNIGSDRVIGYAPQDAVADSTDWRFFNGFSNTNTVDINNSRKQGGTPTNQNGVNYDITLGNNFLYDNINETYIISNSNVQLAILYPYEIFVDVGSQDVIEVIIQEDGVTVFDGKAAYDTETGNIGLYDTVSQTLKYNSSLTMTKGNDVHTFTLSESSISFESVGGTASVTVTSETGWTCETPSAFTFSTTSGASGQTVITITANAYTGYTDIIEDITFTDDDGYTNTLKIRQKKQIVGYTFCDRIYNNGEAYIDTGIIADSSTTIQIRIKNRNELLATGFWSKYVGNSVLNLCKYEQDNDYIKFTYGNAGVGDGRTLSFALNAEFNFTLANSGLTMGTGTTAITVTSFTEAQDTIRIGDEGCYADFGRCTIYKNGYVVADYFPVIFGGQVGMYDNINKLFVGNSGSGAGFTAIDTYGSVVVGEDPAEDIRIGSDEVSMLFIGNRPIYAPYTPPFEGLAVSSTANLALESGSTTTIDIRSSEDWTLSIPSAATWLSASTLSGRSGRETVILQAVESNTAATRTATITASTANYSATCVVTQFFIDYVEYIQTDGYDILYDTGVKMTKSGQTVILDFMPLNGEKHYDAFLSYMSQQDNDSVNQIHLRQSSLNNNPSGDYWYSVGGISNQTISGLFNANVRAYVVMSNTGITVNGVSSAVSTTQVTTTQSNIYINGDMVANQNYRCPYARYYGFKLIDDDGTTVLADLRPALYGNTPCFYDAVNDVYIYQFGNGTPTAGPRI